MLAGGGIAAHRGFERGHFFEVTLWWSLAPQVQGILFLENIRPEIHNETGSAFIFAPQRYFICFCGSFITCWKLDHVMHVTLFLHTTILAPAFRGD